jgi:hypothetical protein
MVPAWGLRTRTRVCLCAPSLPRTRFPRGSPHGFPFLLLGRAQRVAMHQHFFACVPARLSAVVLHVSAPRAPLSCQFSWTIISDVDIESEKWRCCGAARFTWTGVVRALCLRKYTGRIWYLPSVPLQRGAAATAVGAAAGAGAGADTGAGTGADATADAGAGVAEEKGAATSEAALAPEAVSVGTGTGMPPAAGAAAPGGGGGGGGEAAEAMESAADVRTDLSTARRFPTSLPPLNEPVPATWKARANA